MADRSDTQRSFDPGIVEALIASLKALPADRRQQAAQDYIDILESTGARAKPQAISDDLVAYDGGIFGDAPAVDRRFVPDFNQLDGYVRTLKALGTKIVLVSGTFDMFHVGHARYLSEARKHGDFMIVGVDSDSKVKARKGPNRPLVPEEERLELLCHIRGVGFATLKSPSHEKWELIKTVLPDTLIATEETYRPEEIIELEANYCGRVIKLPRQAETSTSARIRDFQMNANGDVARKALEALQDVLGPLVDGSENARQ